MSKMSAAWWREYYARRKERVGELKCACGNPAVEIASDNSPVCQRCITLERERYHLELQTRIYHPSPVLAFRIHVDVPEDIIEDDGFNYRYD